MSLVKKNSHKFSLYQVSSPVYFLKCVCTEKLEINVFLLLFFYHRYFLLDVSIICLQIGLHSQLVHINVPSLGYVHE